VDEKYCLSAINHFPVFCAFSGRSKPSKYSKWLEKADKEEKRQNLAPKALNSLEFAFAFPANPFTFALLIFRKTYGKP